MSYSFNVAASTKAGAIESVSQELDKVIMQQPIHAKDRDVHFEAADSMVGLLRDPRENEAVLVNMSGSCYENGDDGFEGASLNVSVSFRPTSAGE